MRIYTELSEDHKRKISIATKRSWQNPEYRERMMGFRKDAGWGKWNIGKKRTEEWKRKRSGLYKGREGHPHSEETKRLLSKIRKAMWDNPEVRPKMERALKKTHEKRGFTSIEIKIYSELARLDLIFDKQKLINGRFLVDAYIPSLNLVIEADGDYWHSLDWAVRNDKRKNAYLRKCGYQVLRIPEHEILDKGFNLETLC